MEKSDVFKKREKLAYSPEGGRSDEQPIKQFREPLQQIISSQDTKIFKFDRVFDSNRKLQNIYSDMLEKNIEDSILKKNTCLLFNIGRLDTVISYEKSTPDGNIKQSLIIFNVFMLQSKVCCLESLTLCSTRLGKTDHECLSKLPFGSWRLDHYIQTISALFVSRVNSTDH